MNIIAEMERVIKEFTGCDNTAANLTANQLLDLFDLLGLELK
jgi:hypothetical protein